MILIIIKRMSVRAIPFLAILVLACAGNYKVKPTNETKIPPSKGTGSEITTTEESPTAGQKLQQAINTLTQEIKASISDGGFHKAAVVPLTTLRGEQSDLGLYITDKLTSMLSGGSGQLEMVERSKINAALAEIKLGESGLLSEETIQKTGKALGVDAVVVGTITDLGQEVDINVRIFSVSTLKILGKASQLLPKDDVVTSLLHSVEPSQQLSGQIKGTEHDKISKGVKYTFYDDFTSSDFSRYRVSRGAFPKTGKATFNPEAGVVEITTGDNTDVDIAFNLEREIQSGRIEVEFLPMRLYPESGNISLYALTSSNNGYCFLYPASKYNSRIAKVVSNQDVVLAQRAGDTFSLNQDHRISLEFNPTSIQGWFDGKIIHSVSNDARFNITYIKIRVTQMNAYIKSLKVEEK